MKKSLGSEILWRSGFLPEGRLGRRIVMLQSLLAPQTPHRPAGSGEVSTHRPNALNLKLGAHFAALISYPKYSKSEGPSIITRLEEVGYLCFLSISQKIKNCLRYTVWPFSFISLSQLSSARPNCTFPSKFTSGPKDLSNNSFLSNNHSLIILDNKSKCFFVVETSSVLSINLDTFWI